MLICSLRPLLRWILGVLINPCVGVLYRDSGYEVLAVFAYLRLDLQYYLLFRVLEERCLPVCTRPASRPTFSASPKVPNRTQPVGNLGRRKQPKCSAQSNLLPLCEKRPPPRSPDHASPGASPHRADGLTSGWNINRPACLADLADGRYQLW